jgi:hypothetical protein
LVPSDQSWPAHQLDPLQRWRTRDLQERAESLLPLEPQRELRPLRLAAREQELSWGEPQNLGPTINTASVETVPALSRDGHWLFFNAFNRPGGFGGFDIWASYRDNVHDDFAWQTPVNLGPGVNSPVNDVGPSY